MKIIECPRDAMQGMLKFIPTAQKIKYINQLLRVGFDTIDFGSFVSPKLIPQLKDTSDVIKGLDLSDSRTKLLSIIANYRGAVNACSFDEINYLGFPLSVSEEFQKRNTNKSILDAMTVLKKIHELTLQYNKELVVYISMAFGNPYNESYHVDLVCKLTNSLHDMGVKTISLSDTVGVASVNNIQSLFSILITEYPSIDFGAHFHAHPSFWKEKIKIAYDVGCRRFDGALKGYGGCPMAKDKLIGNIATEKLVEYFADEINVNISELHRSIKISKEVFKY